MLRSTAQSTSNQQEVIKTEFSYPKDHTNEDMVYEQMVNKNMLSNPIEESNSTYDSDDNLITRLFTKRINYVKTGSFIVPKDIQVSKEANNLEDKLIYHNYDGSGNPTVVSQESGPKSIIVWGYNKRSLPIAKIENAEYSEVSSFTGDLFLASIADDDRTEGNSGKEGALREALQDLRDALPNAMVTTYTYDPLVGVTSVTDPKGYTMYYEYDNFNRLLRVKDEQGNILSENHYNYKNQN